MIDANTIDTASRLPERFADRLPDDDLAPITEYRDADEYEEMLELLLATLRDVDAHVTISERDDLRTLLESLGISTSPLDELNLTE